MAGSSIPGGKFPGGSRFLVPLTFRVPRLGRRELGRAERERGGAKLQERFIDESNALD